MREAADERVAVECLELGEARAVDDARDHLERVELVPEVLRHDAVQVCGIDNRRRRCRELPRHWCRVAQVPDDLARERERVVVGGRVMVGDARASRVHVGAA